MASGGGCSACSFGKRLASLTGMTQDARIQAAKNTLPALCGRRTAPARRAGAPVVRGASRPSASLVVAGALRDRFSQADRAAAVQAARGYAEQAGAGAERRVLSLVA